jgi:hypothetical protein
MSLSINEFASRPVHTASAVKVSFLLLGVIASLAVGKALLEQGLTTPANAEPVAVRTAVAPAPVSARAPKKDFCRVVEVEIEDDAGVGGRGVVVCGRAR